MKTAVHSLRLAVMGDKLYRLAGDTYSGNKVRTVEVFDGVAWTDVASMSTSRSLFGVAVLYNRIFVIGGNNWYATCKIWCRSN